MSPSIRECYDDHTLFFALGSGNFVLKFIDLSFHILQKTNVLMRIHVSKYTILSQIIGQVTSIL